MNYIVRILLAASLCVLAHESHAMVCVKDRPPTGGGTVTYEQGIGTTVAVPRVLPAGTVLWRSPTYTLVITCFHDRDAGAENVYFYMSPDDPDLNQLGRDVEIGIGLVGPADGSGPGDKRCSAIGGGQGGGNCKIKLDAVVPACWGTQDRGCGGTRFMVKFTLTFNFFLAKRSGPGSGQDGPLTGIRGEYPIFQLDGAQALNNVPDRNLRMIVTGLDKLHYVACASTLSIEPDTLRFGGIHSMYAERDKTAKVVPFSITARKPCTSVYALTALMKPLNGTIQPGNHVLVPNDNPSVGITLRRAEDESAVPFNQEFDLIPRTGDMVVVKKFFAQLKWLTDKPTLGPFSTGATIDVYYK